MRPPFGKKEMDRAGESARRSRGLPHPALRFSLRFPVGVDRGLPAWGPTPDYSATRRALGAVECLFPFPPGLNYYESQGLNNASVPSEASICSILLKLPIKTK